MLNNAESKLILSETELNFSVLNSVDFAKIRANQLWCFACSLNQRWKTSISETALFSADYLWNFHPRHFSPFSRLNKFCWPLFHSWMSFKMWVIDAMFDFGWLSVLYKMSEIQLLIKLKFSMSIWCFCSKELSLGNRAVANWSFDWVTETRLLFPFQVLLFGSL